MKTLILLSLFILVSCSDDSFKKVERLESFRVLGIEASDPEVDPSANTVVALRLFVSDVNGGGRTINGTAISCIDPGISLGASVSCDHDPSAVSNNFNIDTTAPDLANNLFTGFSAVYNVTVPTTIFTGRSTTEKFNGVGYITIFSFTVDGRVVTAFKRVVATNRGSFNQNPTGSTILLNGAAIAAAPAKDDKLILTSTTAAETYDYITAEGVTETRTEEYQIAWYVTQGNFDKPKAKISETVEYQGDTPTADSLILAIVRDERGGLDVVREVFP